MKTIFATTGFALALATAGIVTAGNSVAAVPAAVSSTCSTCHGADGISSVSTFPNLAGQEKSYLETQLKAFRDHSRADARAQAYMWGIAGPLSDSSISALATYFSEQAPAAGQPVADAALVAQGKAIFDNGVASQGIPACQSCHGAQAQGMATFPRLAGQHRTYLVQQLMAFHDGSRQNAIMNANVKNMTEAQAQAVAAYIHTQ